ncbi:MAG: cytochrome c oxidase, cbb3-type subunit [Candidatus Brocadiaceae bacterium]|nr:cytochrome c oxidase, cbb3-type subunit [Candidatus Brocadiaceae bacterium]
MCNKKTLLGFVVSSFVVLGFYAGTSSVSGQEGEEINPRKLFEYHCSTCHGEDGKGTKRGLELKTPNLADAKWQASRKDEDILNSITNGKNKMPRWSEKLKPEEMQALAKYVRKLAPKKRE